MVTTIGLVGHVAGLIGQHHWNTHDGTQVRFWLRVLSVKERPSPLCVLSCQLLYQPFGWLSMFGEISIKRVYRG